MTLRLITWKGRSARCLHDQITIFPFFVTSIWGKESHLKGISFHVLVLESVNGFLPETGVACGVCEVVIFLLTSSFCNFYLKFYCKEELSLSFIQLFVSLDTLILWVYNPLYHYLFLLPIWPPLQVSSWVIFTWLCCCLTVSYYMAPQKMVQIHFAFSPPLPRNWPFFWGFSYWRIVFRNQYLGAGCARGPWGLTNGAGKRVQTHTLLFLFLGTYIKNHGFIRIPPVFIQHCRVHPSYPSPSLYLKLLLQQQETWLSLSTVYLFICSVLKYAENSFRIANPYLSGNQTCELVCGICVWFFIFRIYSQNTISLFPPPAFMWLCYSSVTAGSVNYLFVLHFGSPSTSIPFYFIFWVYETYTWF